MNRSLASSAIYRILDANLDRAREGLRILEEWCRFGRNDAQLIQTCKDLRQALARWHHPQLRLARNTPDDPGTALTHPQEAQRPGLPALLQANCCRVQEALRVIEEYAKLYDLNLSADCKQMRYRVYTLESELFGVDRRQQLQQTHLYLITSAVQNLFGVVEGALQGGVRLVQYREKTADDTVRLTQARKIRELCAQYGALFIMNDRPDLALALDADGVHLGQADAPIAVARELLGPERLIGRSTNNPGHLEQAIAQGADYVGVGPVYETPTKPGRAAAGLDYVRHATAHCPIPWYAIGGVDAQNLPEIQQAGGSRVAVVRAIMQAENPTQISQDLLLQLGTPQ
ncbi:MAG: thiamine phosphate synthase [Cyanobacteria bacterium P01_G01_bin.54]